MTGRSEFVVSEKDLFPVIEEHLQKGREVRFRVSGNSMWPFIAHNRDSVLLTRCEGGKLKKGDIILFDAGNAHYILHRITKVMPGGYITTGDGNFHRDGFVPEDMVKAKVKIIYRKNREISCGSRYWTVVFRFWMAAFPVRPCLLRMMLWLRKRHVFR